MDQRVRVGGRATTYAMLTIALASVGGLRAPAVAQKLPLDSLFRAHRLSLTFGTAGMSGAGWDLIVTEGANAQFVMVGESHNLLEIPLFTAHLLRALHERAGYDYLALENGPYAMARLGEAEVRGNVDALAGIANRYVSALQFRTDQELELIAAAGRISEHARPLWGLDNAWGAEQLLDRIAELVPAGAGRALAERMSEAAGELERYRPSETRPRYINARLTADELDRLEQALTGSPAEALELFDELRTGYEIYAARRPGGAGVYHSNHRREQYMRQRFMVEYRAAQRGGDSLPRVVLKFGQWHALRGVLNWGEVEPLGTFVGELARSNGLESLHIWTGLVNEPGQVWTLFDFPDYVPLARAGSTGGWWVVDLRPIRALAAAGRTEPLNDELRKVIFGFDLALLIGGARRATYERLRDPG
jgi:hypothetical protein